MGYTKTETKKLTHEAFVKKAIAGLRKEGYKGIHATYSGFNNAFKAYYDGENPVEATKALQALGKLVIAPAKKGGVMLYLPQDAPQRDPEAQGKSALAKMGL